MVDAVLLGLIVVLIGKLEWFKCLEVKSKFESLGVKVIGSVFKKIDFVVVGVDVGSKF